MGEMKPIPADASLSRRQFVVAMASAGGGLALGVLLPDALQAFPLAATPWSSESAPGGEVSAWIVIDPDESITIRIPHSEMGQGAATALPMIVAEELECDWSRIKGEFASANRNLRRDTVYGDMNTVGSRGVATSWQKLQQAGASARVRLIAAAAQRWNADIADCVAANGAVTHRPSKRVLTYGKLAADAAKVTLPAEPAIKPFGQYKLIGKSLPRLDTPVKLDGSAKYGIDTRLPGMVYAAVMSCPVFGGRLVSVDETAIAGRRGVLRVVKLNSGMRGDDAVAVVADSYWRAEKALRALKPVWDGGEAAQTDSAQFKKLYRDTLDGPMAEALKTGDAAAALASSAKVYDAVYEAPHLAHATMEPLNATVQLKSDRLDVWLGTQSALNCLRLAAETASLKPEQVFIHNTYVGGGFGRRSRNDEMVHAIQVAKAMGDRPVKLVWSREQDMRSDRYRPQAAVRMKAALSPDGRIAAMDVRIAVGSINQSNTGMAPANGLENQAFDGFDDCPYKIANHHIGVALKNTHVPVSFWRSVGGSQNCFFFESFVDELAYAAGKDPLEFRRAMIERKDFLGVIDTLKEKSDWGTPLGAGRGRGIAICENHGSIIGQVAEVTVDTTGTVHVDRVVAAVDCYHAVNPKIIESQIEGGIMFGLTAALYGDITIKDGAVEQANFDSYRIATMREAPKVEVYLSLSGGPRITGIGECATAPTAPAVTNAIFAATKKRVRELPLKNVKLSELARL